MAKTKGIINYLRSLEKKQDGIRIGDDPSENILQGQGGEIVVKSSTDEAVENLNKALQEDGYKGKGLNLTRISEIFTDGIEGDNLNLEKILINIKKDNQELFDYLRRPTMSMEEMIALAETAGAKKITQKLLKRKKGQLLPAEDFVGGLLIMIRNAQKLEQMAKTISSAKDPKFLMSEDELLKLNQEFKLLLALQGNISAQVSGLSSEYGRGLGVAGNVQKLTNINITGYTDQINKLVNNMDQNTLEYNANMYLVLPNAGKLELAEKGWLLKGYDVAMEIWINQILGSPVTHAVNIAGNSLFQMQRTLETGLASVISEVRTLGGRRGKTGDRVYFGESMAEMHGFALSLADALQSSATTLALTGQSSDFLGKIDLKNKRAIGNTDNLIDIAEQLRRGEFTSSAIDTIGILTRLPGRFLASEDEFFKVIAERKVLYREAYRHGMIDYETALKSGYTKDQASEMFTQKYEDILTNTDQYTDITSLMKKEADISTFTKDPEGVWKTMVNFANLPGGKILVPFSKTPTNIVQETFDRTLNWSPVYKAIKGKIDGKETQTGREFDMAMSKLTVGATTFSTMALIASGYFGDDIVINGSGPTKGKAKKFMTGAKIPPYSIGVKQDNGEYKYITFSRFDPISGILAMGADYAYYANNTGPDDPALLALMKAGTLASAEYSLNLPFLQGLSDVVKIVQNPYDDKDHIMERLFIQFPAEKLSEIGLTATGMVNQYTNLPIVGSTSFTRTLERVQNPTASNTMLTERQLLQIEDSYLPAAWKGFYTALNSAKAGNPMFSSELAPALDFWGNQIDQTNGSFFEYFSPIKVKEGGYNHVEKELIRLAEQEGDVFSNHSKKFNGVQLSDEQYNEYVTYINYCDPIDDRIGLFPNMEIPIRNGETKYVSGDSSYRANQSLLNALSTEILSPEYLNEIYDTEKYNRLSAILQDRRSCALDKVKKEHSDFALYVELNGR